MARGEQLGRQWRLIRLLSASPDGFTAQEIARRLQCHRRTVYRDLTALQTAGFPVYTDTVDRTARWAFLEPARRKTPLPLTLPELMALHFSRDLLSTLDNTPFAESIASVLAKIQSTLPEGPKAFLERMSRRFHVEKRPYFARTDKRAGQVLTVLHEAIDKRCYVDMGYFTQSRHTENERRVAPYKIWFFDKMLYLVGFCSRRNGIRIFSLERIQWCRLSDDPYDPPDDREVEQFMASGFGVFPGVPETIEIRFSKVVADYIRERIWHETQSIHPLPGGAILYRIHAAPTDEIKFWVLRWGAEAEVLSPPTLRKNVAAEIARMATRYTENESSR